MSRLSKKQERISQAVLCDNILECNKCKKILYEINRQGLAIINSKFNILYSIFLSLQPFNFVPYILPPYECFKFSPLQNDVSILYSTGLDKSGYFNFSRQNPTTDISPITNDGVTLFFGDDGVAYDIEFELSTICSCKNNSCHKCKNIRIEFVTFSVEVFGRYTCAVDSRSKLTFCDNTYRGEFQIFDWPHISVNSSQNNVSMKLTVTATCPRNYPSTPKPIEILKYKCSTDICSIAVQTNELTSTGTYIPSPTDQFEELSQFIRMSFEKLSLPIPEEPLSMSPILPDTAKYFASGSMIPIDNKNPTPFYSSMITIDQFATLTDRQSGTSIYLGYDRSIGTNFKTNMSLTLHFSEELISFPGAVVSLQIQYRVGGHWHSHSFRSTPQGPAELQLDIIPSTVTFPINLFDIQLGTSDLAIFTSIEPCFPAQCPKPYRDEQPEFEFEITYT